jgi:hypothetical protein
MKKVKNVTRFVRNARNMKYSLFQKKEGYYKCFSCGAEGDIFEFIGLEYGLKNFKEQMDKAIELYRITIDKGNKIKGTKDFHMEPKQNINIINDEKKDYTEYYEKISKNVDLTDYLINRGISLEAQKEFGIRFDPGWVHPHPIQSNSPQPMIIIPTGTDNTSYIARSTDVHREDYIYYKVGNNLFNSNALKSNKDKPLFLYLLY